MEITGRTITESFWKGTTSRQTNDFKAVLDDQTLRIVSTSAPPGGGRYGPMDTCQVTSLIRDEVLMTALRCPPDSDRMTITFERPELVTELAHCGGTLPTLVLLALRVEQIFPATMGERRLTPPWDTTGSAVGLIKKATYRWSNPSTPEQVLAGKIFVSPELKAGWRSSDLLTPVAKVPEVQRALETEMAELADRSQDGTFILRNFTRVGRWRLPRFVEFVRLATGKPAATPTPETPAGDLILRVEFQQLREMDSEVPVLPLTATRISVSERRLFDRDLSILSAMYQTNRISSFEISPMALEDFLSKRTALQRVRRPGQ